MIKREDLQEVRDEINDLYGTWLNYPPFRDGAEIVCDDMYRIVNRLDTLLEMDEEVA